MSDTEFSGARSPEMQTMFAWLTRACEELGIDPQILDTTAGPLLDVVRDVARGPSRPAAPLTAFLIGLAAAGANDTDVDAISAAVLTRSQAIQALVAAYSG